MQVYGKGCRVDSQALQKYKANLLLEKRMANFRIKKVWTYSMGGFITPITFVLTPFSLLHELFQVMQRYVHIVARCMARTLSSFVRKGVGSTSDARLGTRSSCLWMMVIRGGHSHSPRFMHVHHDYHPNIESDG